MPQNLCNFPTRTKPQVNANAKSTLLKSEDSASASSTAPIKEGMLKSTTLDTSDTKEKAAYAFPPVEIGTRGTVASLIMQEIEYFSRIESNSQRNKSQTRNVGSSVSTNSRTTIVSTVESTKKKRGSSSKLLPNMCSMVDVSENSSRPNRTSVFSYRNLKSESDTKNFQV